MTGRIRLTKDITEKEFDNGYWYASDLKTFAKGIGVQNSSQLRKDELERLIKNFIMTGRVTQPKRKPLIQNVSKDYELGLALTLSIKNFIGNKETKKFIEREALKIRPGLKKKSGSQYRLNRWRESQIESGKKITYGDLVRQYIKLNEMKEPFEIIPHARYINFIADYLAYEHGATRKQAIKAWKQLKKLLMPKDYESWKNINNK